MIGKKYLVLEGEITSQHDGDIHYISGRRLIELYGVNPKECIVVKPGEEIRGINTSGLILLRPRYDGNYNLEKQGM